MLNLRASRSGFPDVLFIIVALWNHTNFFWHEVGTSTRQVDLVTWRNFHNFNQAMGCKSPLQTDLSKASIRVKSDELVSSVKGFRWIGVEKKTRIQDKFQKMQMSLLCHWASLSSTCLPQKIQPLWQNVPAARRRKGKLWSWDMRWTNQLCSSPPWRLWCQIWQWYPGD